MKNNDYQNKQEDGMKNMYSPAKEENHFIDVKRMVKMVPEADWEKEFDEKFSYMRPSAIQRMNNESGILNPNDFDDIKAFISTQIEKAQEKTATWWIEAADRRVKIARAEVLETLQEEIASMILGRPRLLKDTDLFRRAKEDNQINDEALQRVLALLEKHR